MNPVKYGFAKCSTAITPTIPGLNCGNKIDIAF